MPKVPEPISTIGLIYSRYEDVSKQEPRRKHLGGSEIGQKCERKLWYSFHHAFETSWEGRMLRLFDTGKLEEARVIADLEGVGATVTDTQKSHFILGGFFGGSIDGIITGLFESPKTPHLFECKTHSDSSYKKLVREGVEKAKPEHYIQMQVYMGLNKLERAAYIAKNKNSDELYLERVYWTPEIFKSAVERAAHILTTRSLAPRLSTNPNSHACNYCEYKIPCHSQHEPVKNCRTCTYCEAILEPGSFQKFRCLKKNETIPEEIEPIGCDEYERHEAFSSQNESQEASESFY